MNIPNKNLASLTRAWLLLVVLTLASLGFGKWSGATAWLPPLIALVIWTKCLIVADRFIETGGAHPFIRRVVHTFIALPPLALILITLSA